MTDMDRPSDATVEHEAQNDGALPSATVHDLFDRAMARTATPGNRALQRYLAVLTAPPRAS